MKITEKINNSRYVFKEILNDEWDTSGIANYSLNELEKIYSSVDSTDQYIKSYGFGFACNMQLKHKIIENYKLHIIYYNFPELTPQPQIQKVTKSISDKMLKLYDSDYLGSNDSVIIIVNENISESIEKNINNFNIELQNKLHETGLNEDIMNDLKKHKLVLNSDYKLNHFKNITILNIDSVTNNLLKHRLIPEHKTIRDKQTIDKILNECNATINQLPIILKNDIISKLIRLSPGDICQIKRKNYKCGENNFYRVCK